MYADASIGSLGVELRKRTTIGVELAAKVSFGTHRRSHLANDLRSQNYYSSWMNRRQGLIRRVLGVLCRSSETWRIMVKQFCARAYSPTSRVLILVLTPCYRIHQVSLLLSTVLPIYSSYMLSI